MSNARHVAVIAAALAFAALPHSVTAQDTVTPTPVSLDDALRMAELRSPELRIARAGVPSQLHRLLQSQ